MFRNFKEYQEITKLYTEKVSKTENLEEMTGGLGVQGAQKMQKDIKSGELKQKPVMKKDTGKTFIEKGGIAGAINRVFKRKSREEVGLKPKPTQGRVSRSSQNMSGKPKPEPEYKPEKGVVFGQRTNEVGAKGGGKPSEGDFKKDFPDKKPEISKFTKQGKPRTKAQMMAAKRIGSGTAKNPDTTIAQVKQSNQDAMRARAKEKFAAFKEKRAEKKAAKMNEDITPYDIVLEYLLSTEQAATIEEANYVMTEMDAETIQGIVEMDMMKMPVINVLGGITGAVGGTVAAAKYLGRKAGERAIKKEGEKPGKPGLVKTMKDRTDATNKAIEKMNNP